MTIRHLRIFVTVCNLGSITKTSEKLYLAQPSVSLAIKELEDYYGIKFFDRISRKIFITEAGRKFLEHSTYILSLFDEMEHIAKEWDSVITLRIGTSVTIGNYLLPMYIEAFKKKNPQVKISAIVDNSKKIEELVLQNDIDFALTERVVNNSNLIRKKFMNDELILICGRNHLYSAVEEINIDMLKTQDFILREKGSASREIFESILKLNRIELIPVWQSVSNHAIIGAVIKNLGLSVLPHLLVKDYLDKGELHQLRIKNVIMNREYSIIYHKNKILSRSAKEFIDISLANRVASGSTQR